MQITVFGASGKIGSRVVELALKRGYTVVAFIHSRDMFVPSNKMIIQKGDIHNPDDVAKAVGKSDAVISCLGSWGTPNKDILTSAMKAVIPVMERQSIKRIITLTGSGAATPDKPTSAGHDMFLKILSPFPAGKVFADGEQHMRLLQTSTLDWTTIRSPVMNNGGRDTYELRNKPAKLFDTVHRQAVAECLLDQLDSAEYLHQAPVIYRGKK